MQPLSKAVHSADLSGPVLTLTHVGDQDFVSLEGDIGASARRIFAHAVKGTREV